MKNINVRIDKIENRRCKNENKIKTKKSINIINDSN